MKVKDSCFISYKVDKKQVYYDIEGATDYDRSCFVPKEGCELFRVVSSAGFEKPIVSININKNMIYFLKDYYPEDDRLYYWEGRGIKLDFPFVNILEAV